MKAPESKNAPRLVVVADDGLLDKIDVLRKRADGLPTRSDMIRRLVEDALATAPKPARRAS